MNDLIYACLVVVSLGYPGEALEIVVYSDNYIEVSIEEQPGEWTLFNAYYYETDPATRWTE